MSKQVGKRERLAKKHGNEKSQQHTKSMPTGFVAEIWDMKDLYDGFHREHIRQNHRPRH
jgi:hypothetical protein